MYQYGNLSRSILMKNLLYISLLILLVLSCKNSNEVSVSKENTIIPDTVSKEEIIEVKYDTIIKTSEPFKLNNILCYWEHTLIVANYTDYSVLHNIVMKLKDYKTGRLIVEESDYVKYEGDFEYKSDNYFEEINKRYFKDVNFDGYKDFITFSYGSMGMTNHTGIYIFDKQTQTFVSKKDADGEDLSDNYIEETDSVNRILVTSSFDMEAQYTRKHHFDKNGKIKFSEYITERSVEISDTIYGIFDYSKIINGKEIERRIDTLKWD